MICLAEYPDNPLGEWRFRLFDTLVRVKFWFWLIVVILGGEQPAVPLLIWVSVCFVSILLHEFGHVWAFRLFGERAQILLYWWGGVAIPRRGVATPLARFMVALAGPAVGFALGAAGIGVAVLTGASVHFRFVMFLPVLRVLPAALNSAGLPLHLSYWYTFLNDLLWVNLYWGLVNLLPIYPLDGGHAARAVFEQRDPFRGRRNSLVLSAAAAGAVVLLGIFERDMYIVAMFGVLAVSSLQLLEAATSRMGYGPSRR